jgi:hypothetical protein
MSDLKARVDKLLSRIESTEKIQIQNDVVIKL